MRISDWSSDVCSSDLGRIGGNAVQQSGRGEFSNVLDIGGVDEEFHGEALQWRSDSLRASIAARGRRGKGAFAHAEQAAGARSFPFFHSPADRKSTRLNSSH